MPNSGLLPFNVEETQDGAFLTFVVSGTGECNLRCAICIIGQRKEIIRGSLLQPSDFVRFIRETAARKKVFALAVQGYEPLLPSSLPFTQAILATGGLLGLPTSMVTNGILLKDATDWLSVLTPTKIGISVDSALPAVHDRLRGMEGAWAATMHGIRAAVKVLSDQTSLAAISVLIPSEIDGLRGMPKLLRDEGIGHWILSPLIRIGREERGGVVGARQEIFQNILALQNEADRACIRLTVDDELDNLQHRQVSLKNSELRRVEFRTLPRAIELFRLLPSGHCSTGHEVLMRLKPGAPKWHPGKRDAADFLDYLSHRQHGERTTVCIQAVRS